jgi:hypothetical protein
MSACLPATARAERAGRAGGRNRLVAGNAQNVTLGPGPRLRGSQAAQVARAYLDPAMVDYTVHRNENLEWQ